MKLDKAIPELSTIDVSIPWRGLAVVSPEYAAAVIANLNAGNRRIRRAFVDYLSRQILNGEFQSDHPQPIVFSVAGRMLDGQHRMLAIIKAGVVVVVNVVCGARDELRAYLDRGISRMLEDCITLIPHLEHNRYAIQIVNASHMLKAGGKQRPSPEEAFASFEMHREAITYFAERHPHERGVGRVMVAVAMVEGYERNKDATISFYNSLVTPDGQVQQARMLRDWLLRSLAGGNGARFQQSVYYRTVTCLKAAFDGRAITQIRESNW